MFEAMSSASLAATTIFGLSQAQFVTFIALPIFLVTAFYFFIRPQRKAAKEKKIMLEELRIGDKIITIGGMFGTVTKLGEESCTIEIATGVKVNILKNGIRSLRLPSDEK